eukprot:Clim_evm6s43 gene=Clim_evmTU6s43
MDTPSSSRSSSFSGVKLDRMGAGQRKKEHFLRELLKAHGELVRVMIFVNGQPLVRDMETEEGRRAKSLVYLTLQHTEEVLDRHLDDSNSIFLGFAGLKFYLFAVGLDKLVKRMGGIVDPVIHKLCDIVGYEDTSKIRFIDPRRLPGTTAKEYELGWVGLARSLLDWHDNNRYCGHCGTEMISIEGGAKRQCRRSKEDGCGRRFYPRIDPVIIVLIRSADGKKCLLGRQTSWPKGMFSCVSGFLDAAETIEEGCLREAWEETSVCLNLMSVDYHSCQPWPIGRGSSAAQLMIGCMARAQQTEDGDPCPPVKCRDGELEEARWFTKAEIIDALGRTDDTYAATADGSVRLPPPIAIAHHLIKTFAYEK